ncbi:MAG: DUF4845 domain-containing protein [Thiobacillus sp.]|nr:DUF4845 domain-containing protein [Thiobacillus sp.]
MQRALALTSRQRGLTMFGFLFTAVVLVMIAMVAMKTVPAYIQFFSVKKVLAAMEQSGLEGKSNAEIRSDFDRRASVDYITAIKGADLVITRERGVPRVGVNYEFRTKLVGNVSLVVDFQAGTASGPAANVE